mgnify:CR=1 FL=1
MNEEQTNNLTNVIPWDVNFILHEIKNGNFREKNIVIESITVVYDIYQEYHNLELAELCAQILEKLTRDLEVITLFQQQDCTKELQDIIDKVYSIYQQFPKSDSIANTYFSILENFVLIQMDDGITHDIIVKARSAYQQFPNPEKNALNYIYFLMDISIVYPLLNEEFQNIVAEAQSVYQQFPKIKKIASSYLEILLEFSVRQENLDELRESTDKAYNIYQGFSDDFDIAYNYFFFLRELAQKQEVLNELEETITKAEEVYECFPNSENIAGEYIFTMLQLAKKQDNLEELQRTVKKVLEIFRSFCERIPTEKSSEDYDYDMISIGKSSSYFVSEYINYFLISSLEEEKDKTEDRFNILLSELSNVKIKPKTDSKTDPKTDFIVTIIDQIFSSSDNFSSFTNNKSQIMSKLLSKFGNIVSLGETKYSILMNLINSLEENGYDIEPLVKAYCMVQTIKFQLSLKDFSKEDFGHYTSGEVLQILLKQSSDNEENSDNEESRDNQKLYSIKGRTRLGNVKYMNDPEEGSVLDRYLKLRRSNNFEVSLKPSPWFLMSLTTAIDDLAMWSQYGARAKGVCLVFKPDSFKVVESMAEAEWMKDKKDIQKLKNDIDSTKKDLLYRICYLDEKSFNNGKLKAVKKDNNKMLNVAEIKIINYCLKIIKSLVRDIKENTLLYSAVEECLEEIRYLFKVSDYSYESELRILKYADLNPDNKEIKIDNSGPVAKLYLERDMPVQLKQVIFGPKFSNPEHVTPLLQLLDKDINFKRSDRKFK